MDEIGINWTVVATIAAPIIALFVGAFLNRALELKPRLITYYGHASSFLVRGSDQPNMRLNTHSVVLRNTGRRKATNVRLGHNVLEHFDVYPSREYKIIDLPDGGKELLFPTIVPNEQITVS